MLIGQRLREIRQSKRSAKEASKGERACSSATSHVLSATAPFHRSKVCSARALEVPPHVLFHNADISIRPAYHRAGGPARSHRVALDAITSLLLTLNTPGTELACMYAVCRSASFSTTPVSSTWPFATTTRMGA